MRRVLSTEHLIQTVQGVNKENCHLECRKFYGKIRFKTPSILRVKLPLQSVPIINDEGNKENLPWSRNLVKNLIICGNNPINAERSGDTSSQFGSNVEQEE